MQQSADQTQPAVAVVSAYSFPVRFSVWFGTSVESVAWGFVGPTHSVGYKMKFKVEVDSFHWTF